MKAPGQVRFNLTPAMKRAMQMVQRGEIIRVYTKDGNVFRTKSGDGKIAFRLLYVLAGHRFIEDGESVGGINATTQMKLTNAGLAALGKD